ncbi:MAG: gliding motility-associated C-terminal domain-containing protein [Bacteroidetes bacterium]|nr:gliding motility-associated C-terminal domain-containing protein [Bacteroidota bacterium]
MKKLFIYFVFSIFTFLVTPYTGYASHIAGSEMEYVYSGIPNTYLVRIKLYRDCNGVNASTQLNICWYSDSLGLSGTTIAPIISFVVVPNSPCVTTQPTCIGGIGDLQVYLYESTITLPQASTDWVFFFMECCGNNFPSTVSNNSFTNRFNSCTLDNSAAPTNSSPTFINLLQYRFCVGNHFYFDNGALDADGDSLVYSLIAPEYDLGTCPSQPIQITYVPPYSPTNPLASSIPITINSSTGVINSIPSIVQVPVICIKVSEFRNGNLIGEVKREIIIYITPSCNPIAPSFENNVLTSSSGQIFANCNDYSVIIPFDTNYQCGSVVPSDFRVLNPFGIPNPIVSVTPLHCNSGHSDSLLVNFLNPLTVGETYVWVKRGFDGNTILSECGAEIAEFADTVRILVADNSVWAPVMDSIGCIFNQFSVTLSDSIYCFSLANDGTDLQLVDNNGNNYPIANVYGYCNSTTTKTNQLLVNMAGNSTANGTLYLLINNSGGSDGNTLANNCGRFLTSTDTLAILYNSLKIKIDIGSDQSICDNGNFPILYLDTTGIITYQWYFNSIAIPGATNATFQTTQAGLYGVHVTSGGCAGDTAMTLTVIQSPIVNLSDISICDYDSIPTLSASSAVNGLVQWLNNGIAISGATSTTFCPMSSGIYSVEVTIPPGCIGSDTMTLTIHPTPLLTLSDQDICSGQWAILDAGVSGANYSWSNGANTQTISTNVAGTYVVFVELNNCSTSDTATVNVFNTLQAPVVACTNGTGPFQYVFVWTTVPGANTYEVSEDGGATWIPANVPSGVESHGVNLSILNFQVRAIGNGICSIGFPSEPLGCEVTIGNIFTPNGDGKNDFFEIKNIDQYPGNTVQIINRWGKKVYDQGGYDNSIKKFDGRDLPEGIYFYFVDLGNGMKTKSGTVTINR